MRALLTVGIILFHMVLGSTVQAGDVMSADAARQAALDGEITLVDIRTPQEWAASGVPDVAHAMDMTAEGFVNKIVELYQAHPDRKLGLICATGGRSTYLMTALQQRGFDRLLNVKEGMHGGQAGPGWAARGLPVRRAEDPLVSR